MRTEVKEYLKKYWFRNAIVILGMVLMIIGDVGDDPKLTLFIGGGFIALCGTNLILSQRITDLHERIKDLEKKSDESL